MHKILITGGAGFILYNIKQENGNAMFMDVYAKNQKLRY